MSTPAPMPAISILQQRVISQYRVPPKFLLRARVAGTVPHSRDAAGHYWYSIDAVRTLQQLHAESRAHATPAQLATLARLHGEQGGAADERAAPLVQLAITLAAASFHLAPSVLTDSATRSRNPTHVHARWLAGWLLTTHGISVATAARALRVDHSTMLHGLQHAATRMSDWQLRSDTARVAFAQYVALRGIGGRTFAPETQPAMAVLAALPPIIEYLPVADRLAVTAYARGPLFGMSARPDGTLEYRGLYLLVTAQRLYNRVVALLLAMGYANHVARIGYHASRIGLAVPA